MDDTAIKENIKIEKLIYEIRGVQVMLDSDLARLYECANGTKTINLAVKRNAERFPEDFYFQLTKNEYDNLKFQIETSSLNEYGKEEYNNLKPQNGTPRLSSHGGVRKLPYVFTEQGVAMLASVLRTGVASSISIDIMRAFVAMKRYIGNNEYRLLNIENKIIEHDNSIKFLKETFNRFDEKKKANEIYFNGQIFDAYSKIQEIFSSAKQKLIIIDAYADNTILDIIKRLSIKVIIITKQNNLLTNQDIIKYNKQYNNLIVKYDNTFHDRYFILDNKIVYHCGASVNRIGYKTFSITLVADSDMCHLLIDYLNKIMQ